MPRRLFIAAVLAVGVAFAAAAQERTVRIISGAAAGGSSDLATRLLAEAVSPILGVRAVVENRTGANGIVAATETARSAPDGRLATDRALWIEVIRAVNLRVE
ncbi:MAG: hypothetical protein K2X49_22680 [Acetobacteraceae bacterium]|nr:hypothetical protein [Acetobacteraceae bacterium]